VNGCGQSKPLLFGLDSARSSPSPLGPSRMAAAASASTPQGVAERRGIPAAAFVEDVEAYLRQAGLDVNSALAFLQER
jgi:hypothetical protein